MNLSKHLRRRGAGARGDCRGAARDGRPAIARAGARLAQEARPVLRRLHGQAVVQRLWRARRPLRPRPRRCRPRRGGRRGDRRGGQRRGQSADRRCSRAPRSAQSSATRSATRWTTTTAHASAIRWSCSRTAVASTGTAAGRGIDLHACSYGGSSATARSVAFLAGAAGRRPPGHEARQRLPVRRGRLADDQVLTASVAAG